MTYADPPGSWVERKSAVARAEVQIDSSGTCSPDRVSRAARSRGVKIELLVSTRKRRSVSTSRSRKSAAPGRALPSCTRTPSMSVSQHSARPLPWLTGRSLVGTAWPPFGGASALVTSGVGGGEGPQRLVGEAEDRPLVHRDGPLRLVERDRRGVPVEHRPLQPGVAALHALGREGAQQLPAQPGAAVVLLDVEVLEVDAVRAAPGGEVEEPQRHTDDGAVLLRDVPEERGPLAEQRRLQLLLGQPDLVERLLVLGQLAHQPHHRRDVVRTDGPHAHVSTSRIRAGTSRPSGDSTGTRIGASR